jgi:F-type H+-transporting ATPase subunit b
MSGALPQLDVSQYPAQIFWLAVNFAVLYGLMAGVVLPGVRHTQKKRTAAIASDLEAARAANEETKATIACYEAELTEAHQRAQALIDETVAKAAKESAEKQALQQKELNRRLAEAEASIASARDAAIIDMKSRAAELASVIVDKVAGVRG